MEITYEELKMMNAENYSLYDMRNEGDRDYGFIPGSHIFPQEENAAFLPYNGKKIVLYCAHGTLSASAAERLRARGYDAYSLKGGYLEWLNQETMKETPPDFCEKAEQSIRSKKFRVSLMSRFIKAIKQYKLLSAGDRVAVCISGGKDSMLMAKLFQELHRYTDFEFGLEFLVMDPGYTRANRMAIEMNARRLNVPIKIFETDIFDAVYEVEKSPCYLCARMRRGYLYNFARQCGCNKIALGHHYDDVIETILMGMLYGAQIQTMMPKLKSSNFEGMELIRPMYLIREEDIKAWRDYNELHFIQCACKFTQNCSDCGEEHLSKRRETKELIRMIKKNHPDVEKCIFKSVENVNLETIIAYKSGGVKHSFLDGYEESK